MSDPELPLVSIIIASYNHSPYVMEAIGSVLNQTYKNIQLIVVDDASTDDSTAKIMAMQEKGHFLFLKNEKNLGLQRSLARAMDHVAGEYLSIFASDDMILSYKIEIQVAYLLKNNLDGVYSSGYLIYPDKRKEAMDLRSVEQMFNDGTYLNHVYICDTYGAMFQSGLFKTDVLKALSYIREYFWSDDWAVTIKLLEEYKIGFLNELVFFYRLHESNIHKNYWNSFPGRIQVVSMLTPLELRPKALSDLFISQADYLRADAQGHTSTKFYLAALAFDFNRQKLWRFIGSLDIKPQMLKRMLKRILSK